MNRIFPLIVVLLAACGRGTEQDCSSAPGCVVAAELPGGLLSVRAPSPDEVWIVGSSPEPLDGTGPYLLEYNGEAWTRHDTSDWEGSELWWAWIGEDEHIFVGNNGLILEMDRATQELTEVDGPGEEVTFFGVWGASSDDVWAVGMTDGGQGPGAMWRRQNGEWAPYSDPDLGESEDRTIYMKVEGTSSEDVWIVGSRGLALHYDGISMREIATDTEAATASAPLLTVETRGVNPIAVGGAGTAILIEYDGDIWRDKSPEFQPSLNGVCGQQDVFWAVGQNGSRSQRSEDGTWISDMDAGTSPLTYQDWHGCDVTSDGEMWSVGGRINSRPLTRGVIGFQGSKMPIPLKF